MLKLSQSSIRTMLHTPTYFLAFDCHLVYFCVAMNTYKGVYSLFLAEGERHFIDVHVQETLDDYKCFTCQTFSNYLSF